MLKIASKEDIDEIIIFIKKHWGDHHILTCPNFIKYYYFNMVNKKPTGEFIIYKQKDNKKISALFGSIIGDSHGSSSNAMLWRSEKIGAGLIVIDEYIRRNRYKNIIGVGAQPITIHLLKNKYKFKTGKLIHGIRDFSKFKNEKSEDIDKINLKRVFEDDLISVDENIAFLRWRFIQNPYLDYVYGTDDKKKIQLVFRIVWISGQRRILRLVYSRGDLASNLKKCERSLYYFCRKNNLIYVEIWHNKELEDIEYINAEKLSGVYPLYTMPPSTAGNELVYFSNRDNNPIYLYQGDQDRPNVS